MHRSDDRQLLVVGERELTCALQELSKVEKAILTLAQLLQTLEASVLNMKHTTLLVTRACVGLSQSIKHCAQILLST